MAAPTGIAYTVGVDEAHIFERAPLGDLDGAGVIGCETGRIMAYPDRHRVLAPYRLAAALAGTALTTVFFSLVDPAGLEKGGSDLAWLGVAALWIGPFILHAAFVRTLTGTAVGALALLAATGAFLSSIFGSQSSTVGIGFLFGPVVATFPLAIAMLGLDRAIDALTYDDWPRLRSHLAVTATVAGFLAFLFAATAVSKLTNTTQGDHPLPLAGVAIGTGAAVSSLLVRARLGRLESTSAM